MIGKESGQDELAAWGIEYKPGVLDRIKEELDWKPFEKRLCKVFKPVRNGRPSYPPVMLFKVLLLQQWYGLSDPMAEEAIGDRLSFRRFLGLGLHDAIPDETTICRFRGRLAERRLAEKLLGELKPAVGQQGAAGQAGDSDLCQHGAGPQHAAE